MLQQGFSIYWLILMHHRQFGEAKEAVEDDSCPYIRYVKSGWGTPVPASVMRLKLAWPSQYMRPMMPGFEVAIAASLLLADIGGPEFKVIPLRMMRE